MNDLWEIGEPEWKDLRREEVQEEIEEYRPRFKEELSRETPRHPYKVHRDIMENEEITDRHRAALNYLKDEYTQKWEEKKLSKVEKE